MKPVTVRVHPHNTAYPLGTWDVKIGMTRMPDLLRESPDCTPRFSLDQPEEETNLTYLTLVFSDGRRLPPDLANLKFHRMNMTKVRDVRCPPDETKETKKQWRELRPCTYTCRIKARYIKQLPHPMPQGKWEGVLTEGDGWAVFRLQCVTLKVTGTEKKRTILLPGDEGFDSPQNIITIHQGASEGA